MQSHEFSITLDNHCDAFGAIQPLHIKPDAAVTRSVAIKAHLDVFCRRWNAYCRKTGNLDLQVGYDRTKIKEHTSSNYGNDLVIRIIENMTAGKSPAESGNHLCYVDTIKCIIDVLAAIRAGGKQIGVEADAQSGKTAQIIGIKLFGPMMFETTGISTIFPMLPFGRKGPTKQTKADFYSIREFYSEIKFKKSSKLGENINNRNDIETVLPRTTPKPVANLFASLRGEAVPAARMTAAQRIAKKYAVTATPDAEKIFIIVDEADYGAGTNDADHGVLHNIIKNCQAIEDASVCLIMFSASPFEFIGLDSVHRIDATKAEGSGYYGIRGGLTIRSYTEIAAALNISELTSDLKKTTLVENVPYVVNMLSKLISGDSRLKPFGFSGPMNGGGAIAVRFGTTGAPAELVKRINAKEIKNVEVVEYYEDELSCTIEESIQRIERGLPEAKQGKIRYIYILKGAGRRADRFPEMFKIFIDFTQKYSTAEALIQGMIGRASGYIPNRIVLVSKANNQIVIDTQHLSKDMGRLTPSIRYSRAVAAGEEDTNRRVGYKQRFTVNLNALADKYPVSAQNIRSALARMVSPLLKGNPSIGERVMLKHPKDIDHLPENVTCDENRIYFDFFSLFGSKQSLCEVEAFVKGEMFVEETESSLSGIRPGDVFCFNNEKDTYSLQSAPGVKNHVLIAVGNANRAGHQGSSDATDRDDRRDGPATRGKGARQGRGSGKITLRPDYLFEHSEIDGRDHYTPVSFLFLLNQSVRNRAPLWERARAGKVLPKDTSTFNRHFASAKEKAAACK